MENNSTTRDQIEEQITTGNVIEDQSLIAGRIYDNLVAEGCENFFEYFEQIGISPDDNMILLPSSHHYYYDVEDLREIRTIVNLKQLNKIKQPKDFLKNIFHILPNASNFIGNFIDGKNQLGIMPNSSATPYRNKGVDPVENGISSRIPFLNMIYDIMDSRTNRFLTKKSVSQMLEDAGFNVTDITEIDGLTYFSATKGNQFQNK